MSTSSLPDSKQSQQPLQYLNGRINLLQLKEHIKATFLDLVSSQSPGSKALVWDKKLLSPLNLIVEYSSLRERSVDHMFHLEPDFAINPDISCYVFVCRDDYDVIEMLARLALKCKATLAAGNMTFSLVFIPRKTTVGLRLLQDLGALHLFKRVDSLHLDLIPLDSDILSMERPIDFRESFVEELSSLSYEVSKSLMTLQSLYGPFPRVYAKGRWSCHVCDTVKRMIRMVDRSFTSQPSQIDAVVLLDRTVDLITPLVTPLTYEGLVDELFGINYTVAQLPADRFPEDEGKGGKQKKVSLNSSDELFADLRDLHFVSVGGYLSRRAKNLNVVMDERHMAQSVSQLRVFVAKIPHIQVTKRSLGLHTTLAELVKEVIDEVAFSELKSQEQKFLEEVDHDRISEYIEKLIGRQGDLRAILRLVCLQSQVGNGLRPKVFEHYKREIVHAYGVHHLVTFHRLESSGLLRQQQQASKTYSSLRKSLKLTRQVTDVRNADDIAYTHSGYAPLSVRLVEQLILKQVPIGTGPISWKRVDESVMRLIPGPHTEFSPRQEQETGVESSNEGQKLVLVYFIGGVTFGEISALRFLSQTEDSAANFLVATTRLSNGNKLMESMVSSRAT